MKYTAILIPSLEPDNKIITLVKDLKKEGFNNIFIVDDGSGDNYKSIFSKLEEIGCVVLYHKVNLGKGAAIKTGIKKIHEMYPNMNYITADSDGQHSPKDILKIALELEKNPNNLILGVRDFSKSNVPFKSYYGNKISSLFFKFETGRKCPDTQTGLRGIPNCLTEFSLNVEGNRFEYEMNFLLEIAKENSSIKYIPIETIYENKNEGSHFRPFRDAMLIYKTQVRFIISSLTSAIVDVISFLLLTSVFSIVLSTVIARILSGIYNFTINRCWSFTKHSYKKIQVLQYGLLFIFQMWASAILVNYLNLLVSSLFICKIVVDLILFTLSYYIQKNFIFKKVNYKVS